MVILRGRSVSGSALRAIPQSDQGRRAAISALRKIWAVSALAVLATSLVSSGFAQAPAKLRPSASPPLTTRELVEVGGLSGLSVSPDGAYAVVRLDRQDIHANSTVLSWQLVRLRDGRTTKLADAGAPRWGDNGDLLSETPQWSLDGKFVYFLKLTGEEVQIWRVGLKSRRPEQVTHDEADVLAFVVTADGGVDYAVHPADREAIKQAEAVEAENGVLQQRSLLVGFAVTHNFPVNGRMATVRRLPTILGRTTLLGEGPPRTRRLDPLLRNVPSVDTEITHNLKAYLSRPQHDVTPFDPGTERRTQAATTGRAALLLASAKIQNPPPSRSKTYLSWRGEGEEAAAVTCRQPICLDGDHIDIVGWAADGQDLVFQVRTFDQMRLGVWRVATNTVRTIADTKGVIGSLNSGTAGACQIARGEAICITAKAAKPPTIVAIDLGGGHSRILFDPNSDLSASRLGATSEIVLKDRFGGETIGRVVLPQGYDEHTRLPLVITSYTCRGFLLGGSGEDVPEHVLAGLGYASVCVDLGGDFVRRNPGFVWTQHNVDLSALDFFEGAVHELERRGVIDASRVTLTGFSGSATATTFAITQSRAFTAAIVTTTGSMDAISCYVTSAYRACSDQAEKEGFPKPYDSRDGWLKPSPAWNVEKIAAPLLMQLAEVEYVQMMQLYGAMLDYGRAVEMDIFPHAYHYKNQPRQRLSVYNRNVDWIQFWLEGVESDDVTKADQNRRWRAMREDQCKLFGGEHGLGDPPWYCGA
jgi:dipeptidyl aminopeptidase/acylaminoacyl peptidase